ncbi:unnamed protein product [Camellia sinensis]
MHKTHKDRLITNTSERKAPTTKMPKTHLKPINTLLTLLLFVHTFFIICNGVSVLGVNSLKNSEFDVMGRRVCAGKIGDCAVEEAEEEFQMDSESNRRVLLIQKRYISYETLKRDSVPCTKPGASYYNCKGEANPYHRGCEVITGCARSISDIKS